MDWEALLSSNRLRRPPRPAQPGRSPFQQDLDLIVFSAAFRRLAHKTQVHPLSDNDHVHTRLTHSIEVASVGRSLGNIVGESVLRNAAIEGITPDSFGYIVQAACLAHDIGNPPFGHSGEEAIGNWFKRHLDPQGGLTERQRGDLETFEGNAQGFRIITQLENYKWEGGLRLTHAVLGAFMKYPCSSLDAARGGYVGLKKNGLFDSELAYAEEIAASTGLDFIGDKAWKRHPLAFLVEAADDICYAIIDIEDGYSLGYLSYAEAESILRPIAGDGTDLAGLEPWEAVAKCRGVAIGALVNATASVFRDREAAFLSGAFNQEILELTPFVTHIQAAKEMAREKLFYSERKTKLEIAGNEIICGLLDFFGPVVEALEEAGWDADALSGNLKRLHRLVQPYGFKGCTNAYEGWLRITDFISGMTDRYALDLYRTLKGISI